MSFQPITPTQPAEGAVVMTKISDSKGDRNETTLKRQGRLWFYPDDSMHVYYTPTHWRECTREERSRELEQLRKKMATFNDKALAMKFN